MSKFYSIEKDFSSECPSCGEERKETTILGQEKIKGYLFRSELPSLYCADCEKFSVSRETEGSFALSVACWLVKNNVQTSETIKIIRKALGMDAQSFADLLGIRLETLSRWENNRRLPKQNTFLFLFLLIEKKVKGENNLKSFIKNYSFQGIKPPSLTKKPKSQIIEIKLKGRPEGC